MRINPFVFIAILAISSCKKDSTEEPEDTLKHGLVAYYPFYGNANDTSGNSLNGIVQNGAQLTTDRFGTPNSAFYFDGVDDNIIVHDNGRLSQPTFTIAYYFNTEKTGTQVAIGKINEATGNGASYNSGVYPEPVFNAYCGIKDESTGCEVQLPNTLNNILFTNQPIDINQWYCLVSTFENGKQFIYLDGVLVGSATLPFPHAKYCPNTDFIIGGWWKNDRNSFQGKIDDVRYYNRALSASEVTELVSRKK